MKNYSSKHNQMPKAVAILLLLMIIATAVADFFIKDFSQIFLLSFLLPLLIIAVYIRRMPLSLGSIARTLVGLLFIFSGFVKGVDPIGTAYKIEDYLIVYNVPWLVSFSMFFACVLNFVEFITGIMLLFNIRPKISMVFATLMMIFFTTVTSLDAVFNFVTDCGCFGEAVKLSNWQTVYKNLTLDLFVIIIWASVRKMKPTFYPNVEITVSCIFGIAFIALEIYSLVFLPPIDFRDWKIGKNMKLENPVPIEYKIKYRNINTNELVTIGYKDIPFQDSLWMSEWKFEKQEVIDHNVYPYTLAIFDQNGENVTLNLIEDPNPSIFIISTYIDNFSTKKFMKLVPIIEYCHSHDYNVSFITSSNYDSFEKLMTDCNFEAYFYNADDIELKTMIRSNPGLFALKNGIILDKWSINNLPSLTKLEDVFSK